MMKKILAVVLCAGGFVPLANGQSGKSDVIEKSIRSASREEQSAKADALLIDRKKIFEPSQIRSKQSLLPKKHSKKKKP